MSADHQTPRYEAATAAAVRPRNRRLSGSRWTTQASAGCTPGGRGGKSLQTAQGCYGLISLDLWTTGWPTGCHKQAFEHKNTRHERCPRDAAPVPRTGVSAGTGHSEVCREFDAVRQRIWVRPSTPRTSRGQTRRGGKSMANSRRKIAKIIKRKERAYPTAGRRSLPKERKEHTQPQGRVATRWAPGARGLSAET